MGDSKRQSNRGIGTWIALRMQVSSPEIWWGSLWAALCGAVAAGAVSGDLSQTLRLIVVLVLADPLIGNLSHLVFGCDWAAIQAQRLHETAEVSPILTLPYTQAGSPGDRLGRWLHRAIVWRQHGFEPQAGGVGSGLVLQTVTAGVLALLLGESAAWVALVILAALVVGALMRRIGSEPALLFQALAESALPWLLGYVAFAPLQASSVALAVLYAVAYWSALRILVQETFASAPGVTVALIGMVLFLLANKHPLLAAGVALVAAFPIGACLTAPRATLRADVPPATTGADVPPVTTGADVPPVTTGSTLLHRIRWYMLAATLLSALSVR